MYPIITPIFITQSEPKKCPNCHKKEDKKEVCKHCEYVYKEEKFSFPKWYLWGMIIFSVGIALYMLLTKTLCYRDTCNVADVFLTLLGSCVAGLVFPLTIVLLIITFIVNLI